MQKLCQKTSQEHCVALSPFSWPICSRSLHSFVIGNHAFGIRLGSFGIGEHRHPKNQKTNNSVGMLLDQAWLLELVKTDPSNQTNNSVGDSIGKGDVGRHLKPSPTADHHSSCVSVEILQEASWRLEARKVAGKCGLLQIMSNHGHPNSEIWDWRDSCKMA